jgi:hypothetical protein
MPIHLAIDYHRKGVFCAILEKVLEEFGVGDELSEEPAPFQVMDSLMSETSLASRCVIK